MIVKGKPCTAESVGRGVLGLSAGEYWLERQADGVVIQPCDRAALLADREEMLAVLRACEWKSGHYREDSRCPACDGLKPDPVLPDWHDGHAASCRLAALLGKGER